MSQSPNVGLEELPSDVWRVITSYLSQTDLQSLSLVSRQLNQVVPGEDLFRHYVLLRTDGVFPSTLLTSAIGWRQLFGRICSIRHKPKVEHVEKPLKSPLRLVASAADDLVLYSETDKKLVGLPTGWIRDVLELCDDPQQFLSNCIQVPGAGLGVLQTGRGNWDWVSNEFHARFSTISVHTGETIHQTLLPLGASGVSTEHALQAMARPKVLHVGGSEGQFLVYFISDNGGTAVRVVNRANGAIVQTLRTSVSVFSALVRSVHSDTNEMLVVGVAQRCDSLSNAGSKAFSLRAFEGDNEIGDVLYIEEGCDLVDAVICLNSRVIAYRVRRGPHDVTLWRQQRIQPTFESPRQQLDPNTARFPMRMPITYDSVMDVPSEGLRVIANGQKIVLLPHTSQHGNTHVRMVVRASFDQSGMLKSTEFITGRNEMGTFWSWGYSCKDNKVLILCSKGSGLIMALDIDRGEELWSLRVADEIADIAVVAEHYIIAIGGNSGELYVYHLNRFCPEQGARCFQRRSD